MDIDCLIFENKLSIKLKNLVHSVQRIKVVLGLNLDNNNRPYAIDVITSRDQNMLIRLANNRNLP